MNDLKHISLKTFLCFPQGRSQQLIGGESEASLYPRLPVASDVWGGIMLYLSDLRFVQ